MSRGSTEQLPGRHSTPSAGQMLCGIPPCCVLRVCALLHSAVWMLPSAGPAFGRQHSEHACRVWRAEPAGQSHVHGSCMVPGSVAERWLWGCRYADASEKAFGRRGWDRVRNTQIGRMDVKLKYFEEVFTSRHWMVRPSFQCSPRRNTT